MKKTILTLICSLLVGAAFGCDKKTDQTGEEPKAEQPADDPEPKEPAEEPTAEEPPEKVDVAAAGTRFDPPVDIEQLPAGAFYCDMGSAHWAGMDKPEDGKCPVCGMKLKQYQPDEHAAQKAKAIEATDDHHHDGDEAHHHDGDEDHDHHGEGDDHHGGDEDHGHAH